MSGVVQFERESVHIADDSGRIALIETKTVDGGVALTTFAPRSRYQMGNHLGSALLELNENALVISYEEYHPYGTTAYYAVSAATVPRKRYRYTGKERDEESGFSYHSARYYAPWLGRWVSADPIGVSGGVNVFAYCGGDPVGRRDPSGLKPPNKTSAPSQSTPQEDDINARRKKETKDFIDSQKLNFGIEDRDRILAARFYSRKRPGGSVSVLRSLNSTNIESFREAYVENDGHTERNIALFRASSLAEFKSGEDIPFIVAIATREGGKAAFSTREIIVASGGKDSHRRGKSGLDQLGKKDKVKIFREAGLYIRTIPKEDLRNKAQSPAFIQERDLFFGQMISTASHEKLLRKRVIGLYLRRVGVNADPEKLWSGLSIEAKRTWLALAMSGMGFVGRALKALGREQGNDVDLNGIMTFGGFKRSLMHRVIMARSNALRAAAFGNMNKTTSQ